MLKIASVVAGCVAASAAQAQYFSFELPQYNGSPAGTNLVGQNGWTASPVAGSLPFNVHTYAGNTSGFVQNPVGGNQYAGGVSGTAGPARGQVGVAFGAGTYTLSYDTNGVFTGTAPAALNLGSFSLNHNTLAAGAFQGFINLFNFTTPATPATGWKSEFNVVDANNVALNNQSPGAFWQNLVYNQWYRSYVTVDFNTHLITNVGIVNLHTGLGANASPTGWYLNGGAASALPLPDAIRIFAGGNAGNHTGWDNINVIPSPSVMALMGLGGLLAARRRRA